MDCPNCEKRPVKRFYTFRSNGVKLKHHLSGYLRCKHCGTFLKQAKKSSYGLEAIPKYEKGFWKWFVLYLVIIFGLLMGMFVFVIPAENDINFLIAFPIFVLILMGTLLGIDEIKARYWILEEVEDIEEDQKAQARMGIMGWILLLGFCLLMLGGGIFVDLYVDLSGFSEWQYIVGMVLYVIAIVAGSLGIFNFFSEKEAKNYQ